MDKQLTIEEALDRIKRSHMVAMAFLGIEDGDIETKQAIAKVEEELNILNTLKKYFKVYWDDEDESGLENGVFSGLDLDDIWASGEDKDFEKIISWLST